MAATIKIKNSSTASAVPTSSDLVQGELAVNVTDKRLFTENASGTVVELGTNPTILTMGATGSASAPAITRTGDTNTGIFFPAADTIAFATNGTEDGRFNSAGNLQTIGTISVGNATPSTSGAGITFPATQSASSDANTLDDYEEGTWTPAFSVGGITGTSITYSGTYTKVGRVVTVNFVATSGSGNINVSSYAGFTGLPFTASATSSGAVTSEDIDIFASLGFCTAVSNVLYISKCGNGTSANLYGTCTYFV
jgi:hypothetical protein